MNALSRSALAALSVAVLFLWSCSNPSSDKPKTESQIVGDLLTSEQVSILEDHNMPVYTGDTPPDITGAYNTNDLDAISDDTGLFLQNLNYYWKFYGKSGSSIKLDYTNLLGDSGTGEGAYIFGSDNNFTVYQQASGTSGSVSYKTVSMYSGTLTENGIANFTDGFIMTHKTGDPDDTYLMPVNSVRIYAEGDLLASTTTYPAANVVPTKEQIDLIKSLMLSKAAARK